MIRTLTVWLLAVGAASAQDCAEDTVFLRGAFGTARFSVEIADTPDERAQGLMFVEQMPRSAGMLFVYERPQRLSFWMRNTLIPLDLLFMDATGTVRHVHHDALPGDETPINGGRGLFVLEINGGLARSLGIGPGVQARHPAIDPGRAAWPC